MRDLMRRRRPASLAELQGHGEDGGGDADEEDDEGGGGRPGWERARARARADGADEGDGHADRRWETHVAHAGIPDLHVDAL